MASRNDRRRKGLVALIYGKGSEEAYENTLNDSGTLLKHPFGLKIPHANRRHTFRLFRGTTSTQRELVESLKACLANKMSDMHTIESMRTIELDTVHAADRRLFLEISYVDETLIWGPVRFGENSTANDMLNVFELIAEIYDLVVIKIELSAQQVGELPQAGRAFFELETADT